MDIDVTIKEHCLELYMQECRIQQKTTLLEKSEKLT